MAETPEERQLVLETESQLERWTTDARTEAYDELFKRDHPILTVEELRLLDAIDSSMERQGGDGVWGLTSTESTPPVLRVRTVRWASSACIIHGSPWTPFSVGETT